MVARSYTLRIKVILKTHYMNDMGATIDVFIFYIFILEIQSNDDPKILIQIYFTVRYLSALFIFYQNNWDLYILHYK